MKNSMSVRVISAAFLLVVVVLLCSRCATIATAASAFDDAAEPSPEEIDMEREALESEIVGRARELLGKPIQDMRPHWVVNYALNPKRDKNRHQAHDHARMQDTENGIIVVDEKGKHIGIYASDKNTVIHASHREKKVVEEDVEKAKKSFPSGWRRVGPKGRAPRKTKFKFVEKKIEIPAEVKNVKQVPQKGGGEGKKNKKG